MNQNEAKYKVYLARNVISEKSYIGFTGNFQSRKTQHKYQAARGTKGKFYEAIRKHGWENFEWHFIFESWDRDNCLLAEKQLIQDYACIVQGYNTDEGGKCGFPRSGKSNGMYGKTHTSEVRNKLRKFASERFKGKSYEELYGSLKAGQMRECRRKQKAYCRSGAANPNTDPVVRDWVHQDGLTFTGTRCALQKTFNIGAQGLSAVVCGRQQTHRGWGLVANA